MKDIEMHNRNIHNIIIVGFFCTIVAVVCILIVLRMFAAIVLVKGMKVDNACVRVLLAGDGEWINKSKVKGYTIDWAERYPFMQEQGAQKDVKKNNPLSKTAQKYREKVSEIQEGISFYVEDLFPGHKVIQRAARGYDEMIDCVKGTRVVLELDNGQYMWAEKKILESDIDKLVENISEFDSYLKERNIPFLYINMASKVDSRNKMYDFSVEEIETSAERAALLLDKLKQRNVEILDVRQKLEAESEDLYALSFKFDQHFTPRTGLRVARAEAERLNDFGFCFDLGKFDEANYNFVKYPDYWLGEMGRTVTFNHASLEEFETVVPKFDTLFRVEVPGRGYTGTGNYEDVLINQNELESIREYKKDDYYVKKAAYSSVMIENEPLAHIENLCTNNNAGKRILVIGDSFSSYSDTFLACDITYLDFVYLEEFGGSIKTYICETEPDIVILAMAERNIEPYKEHGMYDFR